MKLTHTGERMVPKYDKGNLIYYEHLARYHFALQFVKGKVVLDAACGEGYGSQLFKRHGAKRVVGIDNSGETIAYADKRYANRMLSFIVDDITKMSFESHTFDLVISFETIEHIKSHTAFINEVKRVLKPEGLFLISTPNKDVYSKGNKFHKRELSISGFAKLLRNKFRHVKVLSQNNAFFTYISDTDTSKGMTENTKLQDSQKVKPLYMIALCSDSQLPKVKLLEYQFGFGKPQEYEHLRQELALKTKVLSHIYNSRGWKIVTLLHKTRIHLPFFKRL